MSLTSKVSRSKLDKLVEAYKSTTKVLEVGSFGNPSYGRFFPNKIGIDTKNGPGVDIVANVYRMPFGDNEFDIVLCLSVLEHLINPRRAIAEMKRVLKPGGKIIVSVPFMFPIHDAPGDYWRFTKFGLQGLFSGWKIEKLCAETSSQEFLSVLLQRFGYQTNLKLNKLLKLVIFTLAKLVAVMPDMVKTVYGDIRKKTEEPEAFTSAFFLVAKKI